MRLWCPCDRQGDGTLSKGKTLQPPIQQNPSHFFRLVGILANKTYKCALFRIELFFRHGIGRTSFLGRQESHLGLQVASSGQKPMGRDILQPTDLFHHIQSRSLAIPFIRVDSLSANPQQLTKFLLAEINQFSDLAEALPKLPCKLIHARITNRLTSCEDISYIPHSLNIAYIRLSPTSDNKFNGM